MSVSRSNRYRVCRRSSFSQRAGRSTYTGVRDEPIASLYYNGRLPDLDRHSRPFRSSFPRADDEAFRTNAWREGVARSADELKPLYPTLLHALAHAARDADRRMLRVLPERGGEGEAGKSWLHVYHGAQAMAVGLAARGVREGDRVLLVLPTCVEFAEAFFAV